MSDTQITIQKIKRELISAFALLDGWFDRKEAFLESLSHGHGRAVYESLVHTMLYNRSLLGMMGKGDPQKLDASEIPTLDSMSGEYIPRDGSSSQWNAEEKNEHEIFVQLLNALRRGFRDQLDECLVQIDRHCSGGETFYQSVHVIGDPAEPDVFQCINFIILNMRMKTDWIDTIEEEFTR